LYKILKEGIVMEDEKKVESMGKITILLSTKADKKIRERAKRNFRSISKEVECIILNLKDKVK